MKILLWLIAGLLGLMAAYVLLLLGISDLLVDPRKDYPVQSRYYRFLVKCTVPLLLFFARVRVRASGMEKVPAGRFLLVGNHRSNLDPLATLWAFRRYDLSFLSKEANFRIPFVGRLIRRACFLPIDREDPRKALTAIKKAVELLRTDQVSMGVYPEGTRSKSGQLLPFHDAVFKIAQRADVPIVVAAISGTEKQRERFPWRSTIVWLDVLDVLPAAELAGVSTAEIGGRVRSLLEEGLDRRESAGAET